MTEFCAEPQIPHADDFCNRELFGIAHLKPDQPPTECCPYTPDAPYPTGVVVQCEACEAWIPLPDKIARTRRHIGVRFTCDQAGRCCVRAAAVQPAATPHVAQQPTVTETASHQGRAHSGAAPEAAEFKAEADTYTRAVVSASSTAQPAAASCSITSESGVSDVASETGIGEAMSAETIGKSEPEIPRQCSSPRRGEPDKPVGVPAAFSCFSEAATVEQPASRPVHEMAEAGMLEAPRPPQVEPVPSPLPSPPPHADEAESGQERPHLVPPEPFVAPPPPSWPTAPSAPMQALPQQPESGAGAACTLAGKEEGLVQLSPAPPHVLSSPGATELFVRCDGVGSSGSPPRIVSDGGGSDDRRDCGSGGGSDGHPHPRKPKVANLKPRQSAKAKAPKGPSTWDAWYEESADQFARDLLGSFGDLLHKPADVVEQMRPCGPDPAKLGDGLLALPTLVHRGPGGNDAHAADRSVLFFTVVPLFANDNTEQRAEAKKIGEYDPDAQIHAGWLLSYAGRLLTEPEEEAVLDAYDDIGFRLRDFGHGEKVRFKDVSGPKSRRKGKQA